MITRSKRRRRDCKKEEEEQKSVRDSVRRSIETKRGKFVPPLIDMVFSLCGPVKYDLELPPLKGWYRRRYMTFSADRNDELIVTDGAAFYTYRLGDCKLQLVVPMSTHLASYSAVAWSKNRNMLFEICTYSEVDGIRIHCVNTGRLLGKRGFHSSVWPMVRRSELSRRPGDNAPLPFVDMYTQPAESDLSPDATRWALERTTVGEYIYEVSSGKSWYLNSAAQFGPTYDGVRFCGFEWSPNGQRLAVSTAALSYICIWDVSEPGRPTPLWTRTRPRSGGYNTATGIVWRPDSKHIAMVATRIAEPDESVYERMHNDDYLEVWDVDRNELKLNIYLRRVYIAYAYDMCLPMVAWSPDGKKIAAFVGRNKITVFEVDF